MAKWGEGDPRWIVEERPDATNVNNWHWKESNATGWSKDKLNELFLLMEISDGNLKSTIVEFEKLQGEATANNRKGKLIFFYEWDLVLKWQGQILDDETVKKVDGKIAIPNLSEENELDEIDITVTVDDSNETSEILKQFMYNIGRNKIREKVGEYIKSLKTDYAKNLILPKKDDQVQTPIAPTANKFTSNKAVVNNSVSSSTSSSKAPASVGVKIDCKTLVFEEKFQCKAEALFDSLSKVELVTAFTRGDVKLDFTKNGEYSLFGGNISGKFTEIVPNKKICQTWRYKPWPAGHFSNVEMEFEEKEDHTVLKLTQTLVPANEYDSTNANWQRYYFESIRQTFGFGSFLY